LVFEMLSDDGLRWGGFSVITGIGSRDVLFEHCL